LQEKKGDYWVNLHSKFNSFQVGKTHLTSHLQDVKVKEIMMGYQGLVRNPVYSHLYASELQQLGKLQNEPLREYTVTRKLGYFANRP
jgi:hypothetical protein